MKRISLDYMNTGERFYQLPKALFEIDYYKQMRLEAKVTYSLLKDRFQLSLKNNWVDQDGNVFLIYTIENLEEMTGYKKDKVISIKKELTRFGLLEEVKTGFNRPNRLYLGLINSNENSLIHRAETSDSKDVGNTDLHKSEIPTSNSRQNRRPEVGNSEPNDTEVSNTELSDTDIISSLPSEDDDINNEAEKLKTFPSMQLSEAQKIISDSLSNNLDLDYQALNQYQKNILDDWVEKTELQLVLQAILRTAEYGGKTFIYLISTIQSLNNELQQKISNYDQDTKESRTNHVI